MYFKLLISCLFGIIYAKKRLIVNKKFLIDILIICGELCLLVRLIGIIYSFRYMRMIWSEMNKWSIIRYFIDYKKL